MIGISCEEKYIVNVPAELPSENFFEEAELLPSDDEDDTQIQEPDGSFNSQMFGLFTPTPQQQNASNHEESLSRSIRYQQKTDIADEIGAFKTFGADRFNGCK